MTENLDFETGDLTGWNDISESGSSVTVGSEYKRSGSYGCKLDSNTGDWAGISQVVNLGCIDTITIWYKIITGTKFVVFIREDVEEFEDNTGPGEYKKIDIDVSGYSGNKTLRIFAKKDDYENRTESYVDDIILVNHPLCIPNGGFEIGDLTYWNNIDISGPASTSITVQNVEVYEGDYALHVNATGDEMDYSTDIVITSDPIDITGYPLLSFKANMPINTPEYGTSGVTIVVIGDGDEWGNSYYIPYENTGEDWKEYEILLPLGIQSPVTIKISITTYQLVG